MWSAYVLFFLDDEEPGNQDKHDPALFLMKKSKIQSKPFVL